MTVDYTDLESYRGGDEVPALDAAIQAVQDYCGWHIAPSQTDVVTLPPNQGSTPLVLPSLYVTDVASVVVRGATLTAGVDYTWEQNGVITRSARWFGSPSWYTDPIADGITVTFTHGYEDFPASVKQAIVALAQRSIDTTSNVAQVGQVRYATTTGLAPTDEAMLASYRIIPVA